MSNYKDLESKLLLEISAGNVSIEDGMKQLRTIQTNQHLNNNTINIKFGKKQNISIYGLQRFPITLYAPQWIKICQLAPDLLKFIINNENELDWKDTDKIELINKSKEIIEKLQDNVLNDISSSSTDNP
tara:strand:- start:166 stop:552 length:387 start_codon:yes stop_codon:yes gene_type:complete